MATEENSTQGSQGKYAHDSRATDVALLEQTKGYLQAQLERRAPDTLLTHAWQEFYRVYSDVIQRFVISHGIRGADVDDCVQEVWSAVALKLSDFEHPRTRPGLRAWLYTVVRNKTSDLIRRNIRTASQNLNAFIEKGIEPRGDAPDPAAMMEQQWDITMVKTAMQELQHMVPEINYRVLEMRTIEECSEAETAAALNLTPEQVRYRKHRTQRKLKTLLAVYTGKQFG